MRLSSGIYLLGQKSISSHTSHLCCSLRQHRPTKVKLGLSGLQQQNFGNHYSGRGLTRVLAVMILDRTVRSAWLTGIERYRVLLILNQSTSEFNHSLIAQTSQTRTILGDVLVDARLISKPLTTHDCFPPNPKLGAENSVLHAIALQGNTCTVFERSRYGPRVGHSRIRNIVIFKLIVVLIQASPYYRKPADK